MIEASWRSLKNSLLYLHGLESESGLRRLIAFYVQVHNEVMPHSAFNGQTPDEVYSGTLRETFYGAMGTFDVREYSMCSTRLSSACRAMTQLTITCP